MKLMKLAAILATAITLPSCENDASVASRNLSQDADSFKILRRVVFYNGITDKYMLEIQGYCSLSNASTGKNAIAVTCKTDKGFKKHTLGLSDNVTYFMEQLDPREVSTQFYKVIFKPSVIIPDVELR